MLRALPDGAWRRAATEVDAARGDAGAGSAQHRYSVADASVAAADGGGEAEADVAKLLRLVAGAVAAEARQRLRLRPLLQCGRCVTHAAPPRAASSGRRAGGLSP